METRQHILLIRLKSIGDVVLTLPAVNAMRDNFPSAKITFLTSKENAPLLRGFSEVNEVISLDRAALRSGVVEIVVRDDSPGTLIEDCVLAANDPRAWFLFS